MNSKIAIKLGVAGLTLGTIYGLYKLYNRQNV